MKPDEKTSLMYIQVQNIYIMPHNAQHIHTYTQGSAYDSSYRAGGIRNFRPGMVDDGDSGGSGRALLSKFVEVRTIYAHGRVWKTAAQTS